MSTIVEFHYPTDVRFQRRRFRAHDSRQRSQGIPELPVLRYDFSQRIRTIEVLEESSKASNDLLQPSAY